MKTTQNQNEQPASDDTSYSLLNVIPRVWRRRKVIALSTGLITIVSMVIVLVLPPQYAVETSILPELEKNKLLGLAGMSDLAAVTGVAIGETPVSKLYPMIISSARILREVIYTKYQTQASRDSVTLARYWFDDDQPESERFESALKRLRGRMDVVFDNRLGTLTLRLSMEEPKLAADVANQITEQLDRYTRTKRKTSVTLQREFIEQRLVDVAAALKEAEDSLKVFKEKNRRIVDSPELLMIQGRKEREVQINSAVFVELKKQVEIAKIEEIKNIPVINVLDAARVPTKRSFPQRTVTVLVTFFLSFLFAAALAGFEPAIRRTYADFSVSLRESHDG